MSREDIFKYYKDNNLLDYTLFPEVNLIADRFTRSTPSSGRSSVNYITDDAENIAILLIDTRDILGSSVPGHAEPPFLSRLQHQCLTLPKHRLILCDTLILDSIPSTMPAVINQEISLQPPLLMQWIIGHEIGHIILGHGHDGHGALAFSQSSTPSRYKKADSLRSEQVATCENGPSPAERTLYYLESEADRFALNKLKSDENFSLQLQFGGFVDLGLQLQTQAEQELARDEAGRVILEYSTDRHPPFLYRLMNFASQAAAVYESIVQPAFFPDISVYCLQQKNIMPKDLEYFFGGFYIGEASDTIDDRVLVNYLNTGRSKLALLGSQAMASISEKSDTPQRAELDLPIIQDCNNQNCGFEILDALIKNNSCPKRDEINLMLSEAFGTKVIHGSWRAQVASYQQLVHAANCAAAAEELTLDDVFYSYRRLISNGGNALALEASTKINYVVDIAAKEERSSAFIIVSEIFSSQGLLEPAAQAISKAIEALDELDPMYDLIFVELSYRRAWFLHRSGTISPENAIENYKNVFKIAADAFDSQVNENHSERIVERLAASANTAAFVLNATGECEAADVWLVEAAPELTKRGAVSVEVKAMLAANLVAARACTAAALDRDFFDEALHMFQTRAQTWLESGNDERILDAVQGLGALAAWAFVTGDQDRARMAAYAVGQYFPIDRDKVLEHRLANFYVLGDQKAILLLDIIEGVTYSADRYEDWEPVTQWSWAE